MGLVPVEKTFPRGAFKNPAAESNSKDRQLRKNVKHKPSLFGNQYASKNAETDVGGISKFSSITKKKDKNPTYRLKQYVGQLSHKTVSEGMLVLGSVYKIEELQLRVVLPGNVLCLVPITNISEQYTNAVRLSMLDSWECVYQLRDMFRVGQHVVARVVSVVTGTVRNVITLSLVPEVVYSDLPHTDVVKGTVLVAAVTSIEEKGYIMDLGVRYTRAFLNKQKSLAYEQEWNDGRPLGIGQLVRCLVYKSVVADKSATAVLTAAPDKVAKASADSTGASLETLIPGTKFSVTVSRKFPTGIQVQLSDNFVGYIHQDHFSKSFKTPDNYEIGTVMTARVLYILQSGAVYFTMKNNILDAKQQASPYEAIKLGAVVNKALVVRVTEAGVIVKVGKNIRGESLKGFIPLSQLPHKPHNEEDKFDITLADQLMTEYPIGSSVTCRIINYNFMDQFYACTMKDELMTERIVHSDMLELGAVLPVFIQCVLAKGIVVSLGKNTNITGFVPMLHASDVPLSHPEKKFKVGQLCIAKVISLKDGKTVLSLKRSLVKSKAPMLSRFFDANVGDSYEGTVLQASGKGLLVQFFDKVTGWVPPEMLADFNKKLTDDDVLKRFHVGQLLHCTIAYKNETTQKLTLRLQDDHCTNENTHFDGGKTTSNASSGEVSTNKSKKKKSPKKKAQVEDQIIEELELPKKRKMCAKADTPIKVTKLQNEKSKNALLESSTGLKPLLSEKKVKENGLKSKKRHLQDGSITDDITVIKKLKSKNKVTNGDTKVENVDTTKKLSIDLPRLSHQSGFVWDATPDKLPVVNSAKSNESDSSSEDESSSPSKPVKRSRKAVIAEKRALAQQEEARLREIERRLMDSDQPPQSADEFDRLALSSPDSSMVWLQYMAFHLQATEIEKARNVAQRALKTISFREEQERLNVWMALLNLENLYGSKDSLDSTLEEAARVNDAYQVYTRMLQIYSDSNKLQEGDKLISILTRKFKEHKDVWVNCATFYMKSAQMEKARALLQRALVGLQKKEHVSMICRFAHLENRLGCRVRAQTLMEQVLTSYPARVDVWSAYVDMLVKAGSVTAARQVLERAVVQRLSSHKMKTLFKKFLSFEETHGDENGANRVRQMALDYVESAGAVV